MANNPATSVPGPENPSTASSAQPSHSASSLLTRFFSNSKAQQTAVTNAHKPTPGTVNFGITTGTFLILVYVLAIEFWLIVHSAQSFSGKIEMRSQSSQDARIGGSLSNSTQTLYNSSTSRTATQPVTSGETTEVVFYAMHEPTSDLRLRKAPRQKRMDTQPRQDPESRLKHRSLSKPNSAFQAKNPMCLYHEGSQLPNAGGSTALAVCILYDVWIVIFVLAVLAYEHKRLRFDRRTHSASVLGLMEFWLASDILVRGVEVQLQLAAALLILAAFPNLWYGLPETYRQREKLFALLLARADWATGRPGATGSGTPGPSGPGALAGPLGGAGVGATATAAATGTAPGGSTGAAASAPGGAPGAPAGGLSGPPPVAPVAPPIVLPEKDLVAADDLPAWVFDSSVGDGLSGEEIKARFGEIPEHVRKAIPGGLPDPRHRQLTMQEMMWKTLFDQQQGTGSGGSGTASAGGSGGGMMDRMMVMIMMNMMGGMSAPGGTGGMMQPREQPVVASTSMQTGLPLQNAYGLGGYSQNPYGNGATAGGDSALARLMQREAARNAMFQQ